MSQKRLSRQRQSYDVIRFTTGNFEIKELYSETEVIDWCATAHSRIAGVFLHATEPRRRKATRSEYQHDKSVGLNRPRYATVLTENWIIGLDDKRASLAHFIQQSIRNHFVRPRDLPDWLRVNEQLAIKAAAQVEYKLIRLELERLCDEGDVWYEESCGIWCIRQSVIDTHTEVRHSRKQRVKDDHRNEHGMVRSQRKKRGRPSGASVSWQPAS